MNLTQWQKKQAILLYHFSSLNYLEGLKDRVRVLRIFAEGILDKSGAEDRDKFLRSKQWGDRNTSENWANNAWPFLADLQRSITQSIADRRSNIYHKTSVYQCARGIGELSMQWTLPEEQDKFDKMFEELSTYSGYIDETMDRTTLATRWDDFGLTMAWQSHAAQFQAFPKLAVFQDISANSGHLPPKTGVYVSLDDPDATLQFAWTGSSAGRLLNATTFNATGKAALAATGRTRLWVDGAAMLRFVLQKSSNRELVNDPFFEDSQNPELAPSLVARNAFTSRPSRWCYIELVGGEFEFIGSEVVDGKAEMLRFDSGEDCTKEGFYLSPAGAHSRRYFRVGERFPLLSAEYGKTIWQWDGE